MRQVFVTSHDKPEESRIGFFHHFIGLNKGASAMVEFSDGSVETVCIKCIKFLDKPKIEGGLWEQIFGS